MTLLRCLNFDDLPNLFSVFLGGNIRVVRRNKIIAVQIESYFRVLYLSGECMNGVKLYSDDGTMTVVCVM